MEFLSRQECDVSSPVIGPNSTALLSLLTAVSEAPWLLTESPSWDPETVVQPASCRWGDESRRMSRPRAHTGRCQRWEENRDRLQSAVRALCRPVLSLSYWASLCSCGFCICFKSKPVLAASLQGWLHCVTLGTIPCRVGHRSSAQEPPKVNKSWKDCHSRNSVQNRLHSRTCGPQTGFMVEVDSETQKRMFLFSKTHHQFRWIYRRGRVSQVGRLSKALSCIQSIWETETTVKCKWMTFSTLISVKTFVSPWPVFDGPWKLERMSTPLLFLCETQQQPREGGWCPGTEWGDIFSKTLV